MLWTDRFWFAIYIIKLISWKSEIDFVKETIFNLRELCNMSSISCEYRSCFLSSTCKQNMKVEF